MQLFALSWLLSAVLILYQSALPFRDFLIVGVVFLVLVAFRYRRIRTLVAGILAGVISLALALHQLEARQLQVPQISVDTQLRVRIVNVPAQYIGRLQFEAQVLNCLSCEDEFGPERVKLSWYSFAAELHAGETWDMTVRLKPITGLRNPGGFDQAQSAIAKNLHARGYVREKPPPIRVAPASATDVSALRERLSLSVAQLPSAASASALVQALTLGVKHHIEQDTWALLRDTGTSHLVAISGLHISLLAGWAYWFGRFLLRRVVILSARAPALANRIDPHVGGLLISLSAAVCYALLAGFELPVQRAVLMLLVWVVASWRFRALPPMMGLAIALVVVMLNNAFSTLSPGFWLSFGTVALLFYLHRGHVRSFGAKDTQECQSSSKNWLIRILQVPTVLKLHTVLGLCLLPVTAWFFQSGSLVAPLANLVAVPWVGIVVVPLCFLSLLLSTLTTRLANHVLELAQWALDTLLWFLDWLVQVGVASVSMSLPGVVALVLSLLSVLLLFSPRGSGLRLYSMPLLLPALMFNVSRPNMDGFEVHVVDVGQGLATLVFTDQHTLLFDTGGKVSPSLSMFESAVMPYLHAKGRRHIDTLVVSHGDEDHSFGVKDAVGRFPNVRLITSGTLKGYDSESLELCEAGMVWEFDDVQFSILHPATSDGGSENDRSCVMLVHYGAARALLTGDIEAKAERQLVSRLGAFPVDLLIAPHHGSITSSTEEFVSAISPAYVVYPAGFRNKYGFPHSDVQLRYELLGTRQFTTGTQGAVSFRFDQSGLIDSPVTWWQTHRRFWHGFVNPVCSEQFGEQTLVLRQLALAQKGHVLCGK